MKVKGIRGQTALVTGASSGIGMELARLLAADGCHVVLVARSTDKLNELATELRQHEVDIHVLSEDLADPASPLRLVDMLLASSLTVDVLINNAGFGAHGAIAELDNDRQVEMVQLNVVSLTHLTRLLLPGMIERNRGAVMNVASTAGFQPGPFMGVYYATKAFVLSFTEALAEELRDSHVTATCLAPGPTRTAFAAVANMDQSPLFRLGTMDAVTVAEYGYAAMLDGKVVAIPGLINRIGVGSVRLIPRFLVRRLIRRVNGG